MGAAGSAAVFLRLDMLVRGLSASRSCAMFDRRPLKPALGTADGADYTDSQIVAEAG